MAAALDDAAPRTPDEQRGVQLELPFDYAKCLAAIRFCENSAVLQMQVHSADGKLAQARKPARGRNGSGRSLLHGGLLMRVTP